MNQVASEHVLDVLVRRHDTVASAIAPYRDAAALPVAQRLDAEVLELLRQATGTA